MNRNQIFTTIEFINDTIRMTIGEYYNERFYIFDTFKCKCSGVENGDIVNKDEVKKVILELIELIEEKIEIIVEEVILCLPTKHLIINDFTSTSPVTGKNYLISQYDINEAYKVASKIRHKDDEVIISIAPIEYVLDDGKKMDFAPIRYKSTTFRTLFNVFMLPKEIYDNYLNTISDCNLKVDKYYLDSECLYSGIFEEDDISSSILNLDKYSSSLLVYKKGKLLNKISIPFGTVLIEEQIKEQLKVIDKEDIKNLVYNVGSCVETCSTNLTVCKNSENKYVNEKALNDVISSNMETIFNKLINKAKDVVNLSILDTYVTGIGANIKNVDKLFKTLSNCNSSIYSSNILGLNNPSFCETIGLIKLNYKKISQNKYINLQNNDYNDIMIDREKNSKFDRFILDEDELD